jgi:hypothetical protein
MPVTWAQIDVGGQPEPDERPAYNIDSFDGL